MLCFKEYLLVKASQLLLCGNEASELPDLPILEEKLENRTTLAKFQYLFYAGNRFKANKQTKAHPVHNNTYPGLISPTDSQYITYKSDK